MQELKPVAWMRSEIEKADCPFGYYGPVKCYPDDVPLYAIPDTHRIVPVELLRRAIGREDRMEMVTAFAEIGAIIDKEQTA